jgi:hypothetical protein
MRCKKTVMEQREDVELAELAALLRERNALDARIGRLLNRPVNPGHIGEWIAARIFDLSLEESASKAGYDGHFTTGELRGKTVNVKAYGKAERLLDINPEAQLDFYLVFTGPKAPAESFQGKLRPFCINNVFLFDAHRLHADLLKRGVKLNAATSVRAAYWEAAEIFPRQTNPQLAINERQRAQLQLFSDEW